MQSLNSTRCSNKPYTPDSSHAESWLTPDVFKYKGKSYQIMPDMKVENLPRNGGKKVSNKDKKTDQKEPSTKSGMVHKDDPGHIEYFPDMEGSE